MNLAVSVFSLFILAGFVSPVIAKSENGGGLDGLQQRVSSVEDDVASLNFLVTSADCSADPAALQQAIDVAPAAGASISVNGSCSAVVIFGKSNLTIDGGGSTTIVGNTGDDLVAGLLIEASRNITVRGIDVQAGGDDHALAAWHSSVFLYDSNFSSGTLSSLDLSRGTVAAVANITAQGSGYAAMTVSGNANLTIDETVSLLGTGGNALVVRNGASFNQASGQLDIEGQTFGEFGAVIRIINGALSASGVPAIVLSRTSALELNSTDSITILGNVQAFSSSSINITSSGGTTSMSGGSILIQRNSSLMSFSTPAVDLDYGNINARQNAVLDILTANYLSTPNVQLILGSGMRSLSSVTATCDGSAWTSIGAVCAP